jgi:Holliday junction resolvasome RuvABC endonuclease subunit
MITDSLKTRIIMGIDPSLTNTGIVIIDNLKGELVLKYTLKYTTHDKVKFVKKLKEQGKITYDKMDKSVPEEIKKFVDYQWYLYRMAKNAIFIEEEIAKNKVDTVVVESQVNFDDLIQCVGMIKTAVGRFKDIVYWDYKPTSWKKRLTGAGNVDEEILKAFVREYMPDFYYNEFNEHEVDAFAILLTFLKENKIPLKTIVPPAAFPDKPRFEADLPRLIFESEKMEEEDYLIDEIDEEEDEEEDEEVKEKKAARKKRNTATKRAVKKKKQTDTKVKKIVKKVKKGKN